MSLKTRYLRVTFQMPYGNVVLDESLDLHVRIKKAALAIQNRATITVFGLSRELRESLLSQFTAWRLRQVNAGNASQNWINMQVDAGYTDANGNLISATIFKGQVATTAPVQMPPDIGIEIVCYTRQVDKTSFVTTQPPASMTLKDFVAWVANQLGLGSNYTCETSENNMILNNPAIGFQQMSSLIWVLQDARKPDIVAFIDDDWLTVKDRQTMLSPSDIANITEFVGIPAWDEYGVRFTTLFDTAVLLAHGATLKSLMNPSVNGQYVLTTLEYDLTSREESFYVSAYGSPPAS